MLRHYVTVDVFTDHRLSGNPLAVVVDADGLSDAQMQALAAEFDYIETTFVLPAAEARADVNARPDEVMRLPPQYLEPACSGSKQSWNVK